MCQPQYAGVYKRISRHWVLFRYCTSSAENMVAILDLTTLNLLMQITLPEALLNASTIPQGTVLPVNETTLVPPNRTHILHVTFSTVLLPSGQIR